MQGLSLVMLGHYADGHRLFDESYRTCLEVSAPDLMVLTIAFKTLAYILEGNGDAALAAARSAVDVTGDRESQTATYSVNIALGCANFIDGDWPQAVATLDRARIAAHEQYAGRVVSCAIFGYLAESLLNDGRLDEALNRAREGVVFCREGDLIWDVKPWLALSRALIAAGDETQAGTILDEAQALIERTSARAYRPFLHEVQAEFAETFGSRWNAEDELQHAMDAFSKLGAQGHVERLAKHG